MLKIVNTSLLLDTSQISQNCSCQAPSEEEKLGSFSIKVSPVTNIIVTDRTDFKVLLLVYKSINNMGPEYISDLFVECKPSRVLRSLGGSQLGESLDRNKQDENAFSYYAVHRWNKVPVDIKYA